MAKKTIGLDEWLKKEQKPVDIDSFLADNTPQSQPLTTRFDEFKKSGGQPTEQPATEATVEPLLSRFDKFKGNVLGGVKQLVGATGEMAKGLLPNVSRETTPVNIPFAGERQLPIVRPQLLRTQQVIESPVTKATELAKAGIGKVSDIVVGNYDTMLRKVLGDETYSKLDQSVKYHFLKELPKVIGESAVDLTLPLLSPTNLVLGAIIGKIGGTALKAVRPIEIQTGLTKVITEKIPAQTFTLTPKNVRQIFNTVEGNPEAAKFFNAIPDAKNIVKQILKTGDDVTITLPETVSKMFSTNPKWSRIKEIIGLPVTPKYTSKTVGGIKISGKEVAPTPVTPSKPLALTQRFDEFKKGVPPEAAILRQAKGLSAEDIIKKHPDINLKRDVNVTDIHGKKSIIPEGEALTPYELKGNKILLKDGDTYIVSRSQYQNVQQNAVKGEAKDFAPEMKDIEETVKGSTREDAKALQEKAYNDWAKGKITIEERNRMMDKLNELIPAQTKFSRYQLPGGESYKEILIKAKIDDPLDIALGKITKEQKNKKSQELFKKDYESIGVLDKVQVDDDLMSEIQIGGIVSNSFKSAHWDEPNVLAHLRLNERTYKGKQVTFMEEMQSDWARELRTKGDRAEINKLEQRRVELEDKGINASQVEKQEWTAIKNKLQKMKGGEVSHPLLKNWQELSVKRALKEAVDNNSEYFAWISGEQTSARYDLSKDVTTIDWSGYKDNTDKVISIYTKNDKQIVTVIDEKGIVKRSKQENWIGKNIDEVLGKGIAEKIMKDDIGKLSGEGLKFGGEWASNLYDKQVKNIVEKLTGGKVEIIDMALGGKGQQAIRITPEIRAIVKGEAPIIKKPSGVPPITKAEAPIAETPKTLQARFDEFKKDKPVLELPPSDEIPKNKIEIPEEGIWYSTKVISRRLLDNEALKKYGKQGEEIFSKIKKAEHEATYNKSKAITELSDSMKGLKEEDYANFGDYIEGKKTIPVNAKIAVNKAKAIFKDIANKAKREGLQIRTSSGEKIPFIPRENYYPYYVKEDVLKEIFKDQSKYTDFLDKVAKENNTTIAKAHGLIQKMVAERGSINGHLERARLARLPIEMYERDPRKILSNYISGAYDRVSLAKQIGGDDQILNNLIEKARKEGKDFEEIALIVNRALGREKFDDKIKVISSFARMYNNITKLSLVAITNISDIVKPLVRTNFTSIIKALVQSATKEGKHRAALAGVDKNSLSEYAREQGLGNKFFTYTGFEKTESMLRTISANAARNYVKMLYHKLKKNPENVFVKRRLEQFGLNPNELYARGIREKDYIDASIQAIADMQPVSKLDVPYYWQSPTGKMLAQYKTFAYKQYDFMKKFVFAEAAKGNIKPLLLFLVGGAAVGEGVADLKAFVRGRDRDSTMGRRIIDNLMTIGGIGLATDFIANLQYGSYGGGLLRFIAGPSLSDLDAWVTAISGDIGTLIAKDKEFAQISKLTKKNQRQIKVLKKALYSMPFAGPYLANKLFPTRNKYRARTIPIAEEVLQMFGDRGKSSSTARRW